MDQNKQSEGQNSSIKVFIRIRPLLQYQQGTQQVIIASQNNNLTNQNDIQNCKKIQITSNILQKVQTQYDLVFSKNTQQINVFKPFKYSIQKLLQGYNLTIFAYGQTGSGKTYTMFGADWQKNIKTNNKNNQSIQFKQDTYLSGYQNIQNDLCYAGLIPRTLDKLFKQLNKQVKQSQQMNQQQQSKYKVYCSFLQIYNQKIYDLLQQNSKPKALNIHQSKIDGIFVQGLAQYCVNKYSDCLKLMKIGQKNRFIRSTTMNAKSSRSHSIFQILLQSNFPDQKGMFRKARLNLCDLAGSQRVYKNQKMGNQHFNQLKNINLSLSTLGKVIYSLSSAKQSKNKPVPAFRQSKLTRLLQQSLTGNTNTFIIGNISPSKYNLQQSMNTLKFVQRARKITMKIKPIQFDSKNVQIVQKLQKQILYLKDLLNLKRKAISPNDIHFKFLNLKQQNQKLKKNQIKKTDMQKLIYQNRMMKEQITKLTQLQQMMQTQSNIGQKTLNQSNFQQQNQQNQYQYINDKNINKINSSIKQYQSSEKQINNLKNKKSSSNNKTTSYQRQKGLPIPNFIPSFSTQNSTKKNKHNQTNGSFVRVGRGILSSGLNKNDDSLINSSVEYQYKKNNIKQKNRQKQKILDKLQQLQKIQKYNQQKLISDLQQLQYKNYNYIDNKIYNSNWQKNPYINETSIQNKYLSRDHKLNNSKIKKNQTNSSSFNKNGFTIKQNNYNFQSTKEKINKQGNRYNSNKKAINYQDKIKQLQAKLFGK